MRSGIVCYNKASKNIYIDLKMGKTAAEIGADDDFYRKGILVINMLAS
jgi:hypothetical protein